MVCAMHLGSACCGFPGDKKAKIASSVVELGDIK